MPKTVKRTAKAPSANTKRLSSATETAVATSTIGANATAPHCPQPPRSATIHVKTPAQQEVLDWIRTVIVPALVENFIRTKSSQSSKADE